MCGFKASTGLTHSPSSPSLFLPHTSHLLLEAHALLLLCGCLHGQSTVGGQHDVVLRNQSRLRVLVLCGKSTQKDRVEVVSRGRTKASCLCVLVLHRELRRNVCVEVVAQGQDQSFFVLQGRYRGKGPRQVV